MKCTKGSNHPRGREIRRRVPWGGSYIDGVAGDDMRVKRTRKKNGMGGGGGKENKIHRLNEKQIMKKTRQEV